MGDPIAEGGEQEDVEGADGDGGEGRDAGARLGGGGEGRADEVGDPGGGRDGDGEGDPVEMGGRRVVGLVIECVGRGNIEGRFGRLGGCFKQRVSGTSREMRDAGCTYWNVTHAVVERTVWAARWLVSK